MISTLLVSSFISSGADDTVTVSCTTDFEVGTTLTSRLPTSPTQAASTVAALNYTGIPMTFNMTSEKADAAFTSTETLNLTGLNSDVFVATNMTETANSSVRNSLNMAKPTAEAIETMADEVNVTRNETDVLYLPNAITDLPSVENLTLQEINFPVNLTVEKTNTTDNMVLQKTDNPVNTTENMVLQEIDNSVNFTAEETNTPEKIMLQEINTPVNFTVEETNISDNILMQEINTPANLTIGETNTPNNIMLQEFNTLVNLTIQATNVTDNNKIDTPVNTTIQELNAPENLTLLDVSTPINLSFLGINIPGNMAFRETNNPVNFTIQDTRDNMALSVKTVEPISNEQRTVNPIMTEENVTVNTTQAAVADLTNLEVLSANNRTTTEINNTANWMPSVDQFVQSTATPSTIGLRAQELNSLESARQSVQNWLQSLNATVPENSATSLDVTTDSLLTRPWPNQAQTSTVKNILSANITEAIPEVPIFFQPGPVIIDPSMEIYNELNMTDGSNDTTSDTNNTVNSYITQPTPTTTAEIKANLITAIVQGPVLLNADNDNATDSGQYIQTIYNDVMTTLKPDEASTMPVPAVPIGPSSNIASVPFSLEPSVNISRESDLAVLVSTPDNTLETNTSQSENVLSPFLTIESNGSTLEPDTVPSDMYNITDDVIQAVTNNSVFGGNESTLSSNFSAENDTGKESSLLTTNEVRIVESVGEPAMPVMLASRSTLDLPFQEPSEVPPVSNMSDLSNADIALSMLMTELQGHNLTEVVNKTEMPTHLTDNNATTDILYTPEQANDNGSLISNTTPITDNDVVSFINQPQLNIEVPTNDTTNVLDTANVSVENDIYGNAATVEIQSYTDASNASRNISVLMKDALALRAEPVTMANDYVTKAYDPKLFGKDFVTRSFEKQTMGNDVITGSGHSKSLNNDIATIGKDPQRKQTNSRSGIEMTTTAFDSRYLGNDIMTKSPPALSNDIVTKSTQSRQMMNDFATQPSDTRFLNEKITDSFDRRFLGGDIVTKDYRRFGNDIVTRSFETRTIANDMLTKPTGTRSLGNDIVSKPTDPKPLSDTMVTSGFDSRFNDGAFVTKDYSSLGNDIITPPSYGRSFGNDIVSKSNDTLTINNSMVANGFGGNLGNDVVTQDSRSLGNDIVTRSFQTNTFGNDIVTKFTNEGRTDMNNATVYPIINEAKNNTVPVETASLGNDIVTQAFSGRPFGNDIVTETYSTQTTDSNTISRFTETKTNIKSALTKIPDIQTFGSDPVTKSLYNDIVTKPVEGVTFEINNATGYNPNKTLGSDIVSRPYYDSAVGNDIANRSLGNDIVTESYEPRYFGNDMVTQSTDSSKMVQDNTGSTYTGKNIVTESYATNAMNAAFVINAEENKNQNNATNVTDNASLYNDIVPKSFLQTTAWHNQKSLGNDIVTRSYDNKELYNDITTTAYESRGTATDTVTQQTNTGSLGNDIVTKQTYLGNDIITASAGQAATTSTSADPGVLPELIPTVNYDYDSNAAADNISSFTNNVMTSDGMLGTSDNSNKHSAVDTQTSQSIDTGIGGGLEFQPESTTQSKPVEDLMFKAEAVPQEATADKQFVMNSTDSHLTETASGNIVLGGQVPDLVLNDANDTMVKGPADVMFNDTVPFVSEGPAPELMLIEPVNLPDIPLPVPSTYAPPDTNFINTGSGLGETIFVPDVSQPLQPALKDKETVPGRINNVSFDTGKSRASNFDFKNNSYSK